MLFVSMSMEDVDNIEAKFAVLTPTGWSIPQWVIDLREAVSFNESLKG